MKHIFIALVVIWSIMLGAVLGVMNERAKDNCTASTEICEFYIH